MGPVWRIRMTKGVAKKLDEVCNVFGLTCDENIVCERHTGRMNSYFREEVANADQEFGQGGGEKRWWLAAGLEDAAAQNGFDSTYVELNLMFGLPVKTQ